MNFLSCILDGEMLVWDPILEKYLGFGALKTAAIGVALYLADSIPNSDISLL